MEASTSGRPLNILYGRPLNILYGSPTSVLTDDSFRSIRAIYDIPEPVELRAPLEHERPDWDLPEWTCFMSILSVWGLDSRFLHWLDDCCYNTTLLLAS